MGKIKVHMAKKGGHLCEIGEQLGNVRGHLGKKMCVWAINKALNTGGAGGGGGRGRLLMMVLEAEHRGPLGAAASALEEQ